MVCLAFALWDRKDKKLYLARDKFGEKPLYYGWANNAFMFSSELKALKQYSDWKPVINRDALTLFMRYGYIPEPYSIYENIFKLPPGHMMEIEDGKKEKLTTYWSAIKVARDAMNKPFALSEEKAVNKLYQLLSASVKARSISDVPLGSFLSGGIDSSLVTALLQEHNDKPIKTFSIGFKDACYDEAPYAKAVAKHLGTEHYECYVTEQDAKEVIPNLPFLYDEPFADSSQIPTHLVSRIAREQVTVSLSGDGGDEFFGGYTRYSWSNKLYNITNKIPSVVKRAMIASLGSLSVNFWNKFYWYINKCMPAKAKISLFGDKLHKFLGILDISHSKMDFYKNIVSTTKDPINVVLKGNEPTIFSKQMIINQSDWFNDLDFISQMMLTDVISYLPGDILTKVDRASMGVSLEGRIPFLDPKVFEFAYRLPLNYKVRNGQGKYILRKLLYRYVPKKLIERPKAGFAIPISAWLKDSLKDWAEDLLDINKLQNQGFFNVERIRSAWQQNLAGKRNHGSFLWNVLMFQAWLLENK